LPGVIMPPPPPLPADIPVAPPELIAPPEAPPLAFAPPVPAGPLPPLAPPPDPPVASGALPSFSAEPQETANRKSAPRSIFELKRRMFIVYSSEIPGSRSQRSRWAFIWHHRERSVASSWCATAVKRSGALAASANALRNLCRPPGTAGTKSLIRE
jgi:hypothetical protein